MIRVRAKHDQEDQEMRNGECGMRNGECGIKKESHGGTEVGEVKKL